LITRAETSKEHIYELKKQNENIFYKSNLGFLREHNGLKRNKLHVVLGMPGGGKSTLRNTMLYDFVKNNPGKKALLWLSEESKEDFYVDVATNPYLFDCLKNISLVSEDDEDIELRSPQERACFMGEKVAESDCDLFIFDNITTSALYTENFEQQSEFSRLLKKVLKSMNCATVIFAHTNSQITNAYHGIIDQNQIRGSKAIVNLAQFFYVMQTFVIGNHVSVTLRITKHRASNDKDKMYLMDFSEELRTYRSDRKINFEVLKELYNEQNKFRRT
jgi:KaiC/GvpD/RAD55 family RecA-like ATPase